MNPTLHPSHAHGCAPALTARPLRDLGKQGKGKLMSNDWTGGGYRRYRLRNMRGNIMSEKSMVWLGWVLSALFILFMLGASVYPKLSGMAIAPETMTALGWANSPIVLIGLLELICTLLYAIPFSSILGAVLMMGVFGGAITTQLRAGSPLFSHTLFPIYLGLIMWGGLWLREPGLRAIFPFRRG